MKYDHFIDKVLANEKGYVHDPDDNGGETIWGITVAVARDFGYEGPMILMPQTVARRIYERRYITEPCFHLVAEISEVIANEVIDTGVNMGPSVASLMLQRWLNAFNDKGSKYGDLFPDGRVGKHTLAALRAYLEWRGDEGETVLLMALNCTQGTRYLEIAENSPRQERFMYGWMRTRVADILNGVKP